MSKTFPLCEATNESSSSTTYKGGNRLWIRTPIIPGATDSDENIRGLAQILAGMLEKLQADPAVIERWELCAFNNLCVTKYKSLGMTWAFDSAPLMTRERMEELVGIARAQVGIKDIRATGATK